MAGTDVSVNPYVAVGTVPGSVGFELARGSSVPATWTIDSHSGGGFNGHSSLQTLKSAGWSRYS